MLVILAIYLFLYINNHWIVTTEHSYESNKIPENFDGFRITQVSDLHDGLFGNKQEHLVEKVENTKPDVIFITGDIIDSNRYNLEQSLDAVRQFVDIAEVYYVIGNHEVATNQVEEIYEALSEIGVHVMSNTSLTLTIEGESINVVGIEDPLNGLSTQTMLNKAFKKANTDLFTILLAHRPEEFNNYVQNQVDLVFSGHAHGGQIRIPGIGGLVAPSQGLFPKYTAGTFEEDVTTMNVSRGLGNSKFPFRIFNLPEIISVELKVKS